jgi:hypothetical protein
MRPLVLLLCAAACAPDFHLSERRFACGDGGSAGCPPGMTCQAGWCAIPGIDANMRPDSGHIDAGPPPDAPPDAAPGSEICNNGIDDNNNGKIDCQDPACMAADSCNDHNFCTDDSCQANGACSHVNNTLDCDAGCYCGGGQKHESNCQDGIDNDGDGYKDCLDTDCPACAGGTACCAKTGQCVLLSLCL